MRAMHKIAALGAAVVAFGSIGMGTAFADPPATPTLDTVVGVGAGTLAPLFDSASTAYNATNPAFPMASWDAVDPANGGAGGNIVAKALNAGDVSCSLARPDGASAGITALNNGQLDVNKDANKQAVFCIDFVMSDRGPNAGAVDTFAELASDAIDWSYPVVAGQAIPQPASLTLADLTDIYTCVDVNWNQVGGANAPIVPVLPQSGSGTRSTFLKALGIAAPGGCVISAAANGTQIEENTALTPGNVAQFTGAGAQDDIFPYSIGDWIAQSPAANGVGGYATAIWGHGRLELGATEDSLGVVQQPTTTNSSGQLVINSNWPPQLFSTLYAVVRNGCPGAGACFPATPAYEATGLPALFSPKGWFCTNAVAQSNIVSYGFLTLGSGCGDREAGT
jgi:ABC-type phosphate transport system substrate-binding protein